MLSPQNLEKIIVFCIHIVDEVTESFENFIERFKK